MSVPEAPSASVPEAPSAPSAPSSSPNHVPSSPSGASSPPEPNADPAPCASTAAAFGATAFAFAAAALCALTVPPKSDPRRVAARGFGVTASPTADHNARTTTTSSYPTLARGANPKRAGPRPAARRLMRVSASMSSRSPEGHSAELPHVFPMDTTTRPASGADRMNFPSRPMATATGKSGPSAPRSARVAGDAPSTSSPHRRVAASSPEIAAKSSHDVAEAVDVAEADVVSGFRACVRSRVVVVSVVPARGFPAASFPGCTHARKPYCGFARGNAGRVISAMNSGSTSTRTDPSFASHLPRFTMSWPNRAASRQVAICPPATETSPRGASPPTPPRLKKSGAPSGPVRCSRAHSAGGRPVVAHSTLDTTARMSPVGSRSNVVPGGARPHPVVCDSRWRVVTSRHREPHRSSGWRRSRAAVAGSDARGTGTGGAVMPSSWSGVSRSRRPWRAAAPARSAAATDPADST